jgi:hypothetical protein
VAAVIQPQLQPQLFRRKIASLRAARHTSLPSVLDCCMMGVALWRNANREEHADNPYR